MVLDVSDNRIRVRVNCHAPGMARLTVEYPVEPKYTGLIGAFIAQLARPSRPVRRRVRGQKVSVPNA